jgi:hypothetical protein
MNRPCDELTLQWIDPVINWSCGELTFRWIDPAMNWPCDKSTLQWINPAMNRPFDELTLRWIVVYSHNRVQCPSAMNLLWEALPTFELMFFWWNIFLFFVIIKNVKSYRNIVWSTCCIKIGVFLQRYAKKCYTTRIFV